MTATHLSLRYHPARRAQTQGVDFNPRDKAAIARPARQARIDYIDGGWPGANPTRCFFRAARAQHGRITAFA